MDLTKSLPFIYLKKFKDMFILTTETFLGDPI